MADTGLRMNFAALKRADPYAREIIDSATHVALYTFEENEWEKTNIEGALFVYSRNGEPFHSLVIMNRLNTNNLIEPVSRGIELQLKEPFLLYRNAKCRINGIWFYDKDECVRVAKKLNTLVKELLKKPRIMSQKSSYHSSAKPKAPVDIFSMLSKAQDDFNFNKGLANKNDSTPSRASDMASKSVMDFFAKAGSGSGAQMPSVSSLPSPGIFGPKPTESREGPLLLQRLMSNPAHSVEHIEKQQRSATPQESQSSSGNNSSEPVVRQNSSFQLKTNLIDKNQERATNFNKIQELDSDDTNEPNSLESEINLMHISSPKPSSPLAAYLSQSQDIGHPISSFNGGQLEDVGGVYPIINSLTNQQKPALMPPTMFTSTTGNDIQHMLEPLTRNQLLQAVNYLLKHDADFVNKLHEAYVKSFSEKAYSVS